MIAVALVIFLVTPLSAEIVNCTGKPPRTTPCMPRQEERDLLLAKIATAKRLHDDWDKSVKVEAKFREKPGRMNSAEYQGWKDAVADLATKEFLMRRAFSDLVKESQEAYCVGPKHKAGKVHGGLLNGSDAVWSPFIQERESLVYKVDRPGKKTVYLSYSEDLKTLGETLNDGGVVISFKVLQRCLDYGSPARLAEVIAHEASHFDDLTSKDGMSGYNSTEASAYARSMEVGKMIGLDVKRSSDLAVLHAEVYNRSLDFESGGYMGVPYRAAPDSEDYPYQLKSDAYYQGWVDQNKRLATIRNQRAALVRRHEGPDQAAVDQSGRASDDCGYPAMSVGGVDVPAIPCSRTIYTPPPTPIAVQPAVPPRNVPPPVQPAPPQFDVWGALKRLARQGCARPETVTQEQLDELWPKIFGMVYYRDAGAQLGLTGCDAALLNRVVRWAADFKPARLELSVFQYEAGMARGDVQTIEHDPPERPRRDYPMPGSEPCLDGRAICGPVIPPKK